MWATFLADLKGIHAYPLVGWDGEKGISSGYCAHNIVTFPTWHRPYMLLYEVRTYYYKRGRC